MAKEFIEGQKVTLILDGVTGIPGDLKKYNHEQTTISRVGRVKRGDTSYRYYELTGCVSRKGTNYAIDGDWLFDAE